MRKVGLLYDSVSSNTGDIAIGIALQQGLTRRGIQAEIVSPFDDTSTLAPVIVGGGQLLRDPGNTFYDRFRIKGEHILNSVGVSGTKDFAYLENYRFLSARSTSEAEILSSQLGREVKVLPCTTTILESPQYNIESLNIKPGEKVVGIHLVPDTLLKCPDLIEIINSIPHKKVFIPFTHYNHDKNFMESLPLDRRNAIVLNKLEPLELHSVLSQMSYVIVSSLHASIFSYSQNVPFITMYQKKTFDYFRDRRLGSRVFKDQKQLRQLIDATEKNPRSMIARVDRDKSAVNEALDDFARIVLSQPKIHIGTAPITQTREIQKLLLEKEQFEAAITKRDILMHNIIYHDLRVAASQRKELLKSVTALQDEEARLLKELSDVRDKSILKRLLRRAAKELKRAADEKNTSV